MERTLAQARDELFTKIKLGEKSVCECCDQTAKMYSRSIYSTMLRALFLLSRSPCGIIHKDFLNHAMHSGDYAKLAYWELAERDAATTVWTITELGQQFLRGEVAVPKYSYVYNGEIQYFSKEKVTVDDCRKKFKLDEVMNPLNVTEDDSFVEEILEAEEAA